ncbi:MAG: ABC transporter permease [Roseiflexaceae bacterium]|nr:ABC transporter permease [Roseiflexaceae bacterium]
MRSNLPLFLGFKEIWRNKARFALVIGVVTLITVLVLFIAALSEGLGAGNREYIATLDAELLVYQEAADLTIGASQMPANLTRSLRRVEGVAAVGPVGFSTGSVVRVGEPLDVALIGVQPGQPGVPPVREGVTFSRPNAREAIIDANVAEQAGFKLGDLITVRSVQGEDENSYQVRVVGIAPSRKYGIQPSIMLPADTWERVRAKPAIADVQGAPAFNVAAVRLSDPQQREAVAARIAGRVKDVVAVDLKTAYENTPGYTAQQSTLSTQSGFTLLIGLLVIGGFFQIQAIQKIAQIGMLKAIGASNRTVAAAFIFQVVIITTIGVLVGALAAFGLSLALPSVVPVQFEPAQVLTAVLLLLAIGPIGGAVAVRSLLKVEPLTALGLTS